MHMTESNTTIVIPDETQRDNTKPQYGWWNKPPQDLQAPINPATGNTDIGCLYWRNPYRGGRVGWSPDPASLDTVFEMAKKGLNLRCMAFGLGMAPIGLRKKIKEYPEIQEAIDAGRLAGAEIMMNISWDVVADPRDNSRGQELARLHRIFETEKHHEEAADDKGEQKEIGFQVYVIPNKGTPRLEE